MERVDEETRGEHCSRERRKAGWKQKIPQKVEFYTTRQMRGPGRIGAVLGSLQGGGAVSKAKRFSKAAYFCNLRGSARGLCPRLYLAGSRTIIVRAIDEQDVKISAQERRHRSQMTSARARPSELAGG